MPDTGFFQINDIILTIPPSQIQVAKMNYANKVSNLRTSSDATIWSRNSEVNVNVKMFFSDSHFIPGMEYSWSGFDHLINLVSQLRVTPFCYINNEFIRSSIIGAKKNDTMIFTVRNINISTASETQPSPVGLISVEMDISYFNYRAYTEEYLFKKDVFALETTNDPSESNAWKIMYKSEQKRRDYKEISSFSRGDKARSDTLISFHEFRMINPTKLLKKLEELQKNKDLTYPVEEKSYIDEKLNEQAAYQKYQKSLLAENTSMFYPSNSVAPEDIAVKDNEITLLDTSWEVFKMKDGSLVKLPENPFKAGKKSPKETRKQFEKEDMVLFS